MAAAILVTEALALTTALLFPAVNLTTSIFSGIRYLSGYVAADAELSELTSKLQDVLNETEIIGAFIHTEQRDCKDKAITSYIGNLSDNLEELNAILTEMTAKIQRHNKKWFHRYRGFNVKKEKERMKVVLEATERKFGILTQMILVKKRH